MEINNQTTYQYNNLNNNMKYKIITSIFLVLILIGLINAGEQSLGIFKQGSIIELKQTCANCSYNNVTSVIYPDSTQAIGNNAMAKTGTEYNLTFTNTDILGSYIVNGVGNPAGIDTIWTYSFEVTPSGQSGNSNIVFIVFIILVIYGIAFIGFF